RHITCRPTRMSLTDCSTPFGVIVVGTDRINVPSTERDVCSTPFGVIVVGTLTCTSDATGYCSCPTPFAVSLGGTGRIPASTSPVIRLLNALRRHRRRHVVVPPRGAFTGHLLNALRRHRRRHKTVRVYNRTDKICSTPFGVIVVGTDVGADRGRGRLV